MRSMITRRFGMAVSATAKSVVGIRKPKNGVLWRNMERIKSNTTTCLVGDAKQLLGNMGAIRSSSLLIRIWEQQKTYYSVKHPEEKVIDGATNYSMKHPEKDIDGATNNNSMKHLEGDIEGASNYSMKHQEIEGPTVERDMSEVAQEAREVTESMMKSMYQLSKAVAVLGIFQLAIGAYISSSSSDSLNVFNMSMSAVAFGFPFSMAFMMRQSLKPMHFFNKMEQIGRLQLLTTTMQISKHLRFFFLRLRVVTLTSLSALLLSFLYSLFTTFFGTS